MPRIPQIAQARRAQGQHHNAVAHNLERRGALAFAPHLPGSAIVRIHNGQHYLAAALLLSALTPHARPAPRVGGPASQPHDAARTALLHRALDLPGAHAAQGAHQPLMPPSGIAHSLNRIANVAGATCAVRPHDCTRALLGSAAAAAAATVGYLAGRLTGSDCATERAPSSVQPADQHPSASPSLPLENAVLAVLPPEARERVWKIVSACGGVAACATPEIRALLEDMPAGVQQQLRQLLAEPQGHTPPAALPGASAAILRPPIGWLAFLADLLGTRIAPEQAAFELDVTAIADATRAAHARGTTEGSPREAINQARLAAIAARFEAHGFQVQQQPFALATYTLFNYPQDSRGSNLLVELNGDGPTQRTLMLLAHGDVAGADVGSSGALDNATGVAALLALARRLKALGLPAGTRVQLLVTDKEELGLHGAKAYVEACRSAADCPDVALNLDVLGVGDGLTLSGSEHHGRYRDGDSLPRGQGDTPAPTEERALAALLRRAAAEVGMHVYEPDDWTLQSDHIAFQRAAVPALGVSLVDRADLDTERSIQHLREAFLEADDAVDWSRYEAYLDGTLDAAALPWMERAVAASDAAMEAFRAHPLSRRQQLVHNAADQPERIDVRRALTAIDVVERAALAWLAAPDHDR